MATFTIKKFPDDLALRLREAAKASRRSLTQEILSRLEHSLLPEDPRSKGGGYSVADQQAKAWEELGGKWESAMTLREEIDELYLGVRHAARLDAVRIPNH